MGVRSACWLLTAAALVHRSAPPPAAAFGLQSSPPRPAAFEGPRTMPHCSLEPSLPHIPAGSEIRRGSLPPATSIDLEQRHEQATSRRSRQIPLEVRGPAYVDCSWPAPWSWLGRRSPAHTPFDLPSYLAIADESRSRINSCPVPSKSQVNLSAGRFRCGGLGPSSVFRWPCRSPGIGRLCSCPAGILVTVRQAVTLSRRAVPGGCLRHFFFDPALIRIDE